MGKKKKQIGETNGCKLKEQDGWRGRVPSVRSARARNEGGEGEEPPEEPSPRPRSERPPTPLHLNECYKICEQPRG